MGLVYALGGVAGIAWRCFFLSLLYHVTWFVNSASHLWGRQEYQTGDQSRNNWWVGFLAFGEGWHNNHHAFEYSARHGLRPRQFDITWQVSQAQLIERTLVGYQPVPVPVLLTHLHLLTYRRALTTYLSCGRSSVSSSAWGSSAPSNCPLRLPKTAYAWSLPGHRDIGLDLF